MSTASSTPPLQIITKPTYALDLLESIIAETTIHPTTLIICTSKPDFLSQLQASLESRQQAPASSPPSKEPTNLDIDIETHRPPAPSHPTPSTLLTPTLYNLSTSHNTTLTFCPSINTLRAHLATHTHPNPTTILLLNALALHNSTSEFSAQGLARTFAAVAAMAYRGKSTVRAVECRDARDPEDPGRGEGLWDGEVPLLSGSVRVGREGVVWAGRKVRVGDVVGRWFEFEEGE